MSSVSIACPGCGQTYQIAAEQIPRYVGKQITCRTCQRAFGFDEAQNAASDAPEMTSFAGQNEAWAANDAQSSVTPVAAAMTEAARPYERPINYATRRRRSQSTWSDFFAFRRMITPVFIQALFWLGVVACIIAGSLSMYGAFNYPTYSFNQYGYSSTRSTTFNLPLFLIGLTWLFVGPVVIRIYCELLILFFRMNETLTDMKNLLDRGRD